jgi:hypothetical protein
MDKPTDGPTERVIEALCSRLKNVFTTCTLPHKKCGVPIKNVWKEDSKNVRKIKKCGKTFFLSLGVNGSDAFFLAAW